MRLRIPHLLVPLFALIPGGCVALTATPPLVPPVQVVATTAAAPASPLAWSADGAWLAYVADDVCLLPAAGGPPRKLVTTTRPTSLAFSPDGETLALAVTLTDGKETLLRRYRVADGQLLGEARVAGECSGLFWLHGDEVLATQSLLSRFKFGDNHVIRLVRWSAAGELREIMVSERIFMPATFQVLGGNLAALTKPRLSPWRDEVLLGVLRDPPAFPPYLELVVVPLGGGPARKVAELAPQGSGADYRGDGSEVLIADGGTLSVQDVWRDTRRSLPVKGRGELTVSPGGRYLLLGGALYRETTLVTRFPAEVRGAFGAGGRLALLHGGRLHLVAGLDDPPSFALPAESERQRLLQLRQLRGKGLINHDDYLEQKERP